MPKCRVTMCHCTADWHRIDFERKLLFKKWSIPGLFFMYFRLFKRTFQFVRQMYLKTVHPVYGTRIPTHNLENMSLLPSPLDQGSRPRNVFLVSTRLASAWRRLLDDAKTFLRSLRDCRCRIWRRKTSCCFGRSWQCVRFRYQRTRVRIQSLASFIEHFTVNCL